MRPVHLILFIAFVTSIVGISCRFFSGAIPSSTSEPQPFVDDSVLKFVPDNLPDAQQGTPYQVEIKVENVETFVGEFRIIEGKLPEGLSLERVPGENATRIAGTPKESGTFAFVLEALCEGTNSPGQTGQNQYTLIVE